MKTVNPSKRNLSAEKQIEWLKKQKSEYVLKRYERQIEIDAINSEISLIEAQIANILMVTRRKKENG